MTYQYFIDKLSLVPENTWGYQSCWDGDKDAKLNKKKVAYNIGRMTLGDLLTPDEQLILINLLGTFSKACNDGELNFTFTYGATPKQRILGFLMDLNTRPRTVVEE